MQFCIILSFSILCPILSYAAEAYEQNEKILTVGVLDNHMPISTVKDGIPQGIGVDLFKKIANSLSLNYKIYEVKDPYLGIELTKLGLFDVLIGPYQNQAKFSQTLDFSVPFFAGGTQLYSKKQTISFSSLIKIVWSPLLTNTIILFTIVFSILAILLCIGEIHNRRKSSSLTEEVSHTIWVTLFMVLGEIIHDPKTNIGKLSIFLMYISSIAVLTIVGSSISASIIQISQFSELNISVPEEIQGKNIGVISNSAEEDLARSYGADIYEGENLSALFKALDNNTIEGILSIYSTTDYFIEHKQIKNIQNSPFFFDRNLFNFAFPNNSPLLEPFDKAIVSLQNTRQNKDICTKYIEKNLEDCIL